MRCSVCGHILSKIGVQPKQYKDAAGRVYKIIRWPRYAPCPNKGKVDHVRRPGKEITTDPAPNPKPTICLKSPDPIQTHQNIKQKPIAWEDALNLITQAISETKFIQDTT